MMEILTELSDEEFPDYVNALLDQNRELREENAALRTKNADLESRLLAELQEPPYNSMASLEAENAALREAMKGVWTSWHEWRDDPSDNTIYFVERAVNELGELIPPPEEQK